MAGLLYREDMDAVRSRLTAWWNGDDLGRPMLQLYAPRAEPPEEVEVMPRPEGWLTDYSTKDFAYRVNLAQRAYLNTWCLGEAVPFVSPDLAPNCLALYLGCPGVEMEGTVWCEPCNDLPRRGPIRVRPGQFLLGFLAPVGPGGCCASGAARCCSNSRLIEGLIPLGRCGAARGCSPTCSSARIGCGRACAKLQTCISAIRCPL